MTAYQKANDPQTKIQIAGDEEAARLQQEFAPNVVAARVNQAGAEGGARASAALGVNSSPEALQLKYAQGQAEGAGHVAGVGEAYSNMPVSQYGAIRKSTFIDTNTLGRVQSGKAGDFLSQPDKYQEIPLAKVPDLNKDKMMLNSINQARKLINEHPEYFPDTSKSNWPVRARFGFCSGGC